MTVEEFICEWQNGNDYIVAHTSGSTGKPKEIQLKKSFVVRSALRTIEYFKLNSESHLHLCLSPDYIAGKMMIIRALLANARLTIETPSNDINPLKFGYPIDLLAIVPSQLPCLLNDKNSHAQIKNLIVGGSAIPPALRKKLTLSGINAFETYGMTETASHVALRKSASDVTEPYFALPGIFFESDNLKRLIINIDDNYRFITNDIVELIDSTHFRLPGRFDDVIITGGMKVHPQEVESIIGKYIPEGIAYFITSRPSEKWGQEVVLVIENATNQPNQNKLLLINELRQTLKQHLLPQQCPKEVIVVDRIPRTSTGKLIRKYPNLTSHPKP